jgi:flagellar hook assembly protein FlgD
VEDPTDDGLADIPFVPKFRVIGNSPLGGRPAVVLELEAPAAARVGIYDLSGRRVRELAHRTLPAGASVLPWDERDQDGQRVQPGVYFVRAELGTQRFATRIAVLR